MKNYCAVYGCSSSSTGYSKLCSKHRKSLTRHGHPEQSSVTVHELRPFRKVVEARQLFNPSSPAWLILTDRWKEVVSHAQGILNAYERGEVGNRVSRLAAQEMHTLAVNVTPYEVIQTSLAMYLLADAKPHRFKNDLAFEYQLVRRVRGLAKKNAGSYWDAKSRRTKHVYKDQPPRVIRVLSWYLKEAFGAAGLQLAALERSKQSSLNRQREQLAQALDKLR